ncbi:MAG: hypothetical protein M3161_00120, partial [Actinomycetota bacterium]|nr:hypothetical protein [Actinomycetota bacterium]
MVVVALALLAFPASAHAQPSCSRVVVFTLPGIAWEHVARYEPPNILSAVADGAAGSISVRTNSPRTSYASGFATLGARARLDGGDTTGGALEVSDRSRDLFVSDVTVAGLEEMTELAERAGYQAVPGALASALGFIPVHAVGNADLAVPLPVGARPGRWTLVAAMDASGVVDRAAVGTSLLDVPDLLPPPGVTPAAPRDLPSVPRTDPAAFEAAIDDALASDCGVTVIDHGDLTRADQVPLVAGASVDDGRAVALAAADDALGQVRDRLQPARDLLLVVSPTSPLHERATHFGVAIAVGPEFPAGTSLTSPATRRAGMVTLPDVAPTVLAHLDIERPPEMRGRAFSTVEANADRRIANALELDRESVFVDRVRAPIWSGYVAAELLVYGGIAFLLWRGRAALRAGRARPEWLEGAALALLAFPLATFLIGIVSGHRLGTVGYVGALVAIDLAVVLLAWWWGSDARARLLVVAAATCLVLLGDLVLGSRLQLNTVFS